jgi:uncharacterized protein YceK
MMMKALAYTRASILLAAITYSGCTSMSNRFHTCETNDVACCVSPIRVAHYIYPGTQSDLRSLAIPVWSSGDACYDGVTRTYYPLVLIDLPFSLVADTVFFPYDAYMVTLGGKTRYR